LDEPTATPASQDDVDRVTKTFTELGLEIVSTDLATRSIVLSGSVETMEEAFQAAASSSRILIPSATSPEPSLPCVASGDHGSSDGEGSRPRMVRGDDGLRMSEPGSSPAGGGTATVGIL
jgi:hypothetical protein